MKTINIFLVTISFVVLASNAFSQTEEELLHKALTAHYNKAKEHTQAIVSNPLTTKEEQVRHTHEAAKSIEAAKKVHENLKMFISQKNFLLAQPYQTNIESLQTAATYHITAIGEELKKPIPEPNKVKEHVQNVYEALEKAEKEHQALKEKTKNK